MASNNMINLKVFLRNENNCEARRFTVDASVVTSFLFMKKKLQTVFPILRDREFKITWKDMDGDEITIATDEDFITAFTEISGNVKVLYVTIIKGSHEPIFVMDADAQDTAYHGPRVICDVCNQTIIGFRYKCVQCPDYDLCTGCEYQGHHSDHLMIRVPNNEMYMPKCARKFMHHFARNLKKSAYAASKEAYQTAKHASKFTAAATLTKKTTAEEASPGQSQVIGASTQNTANTEKRQECPFNIPEGVNLNDFHALGAVAKQHLAPFLDALNAQSQNANTNNPPNTPNPTEQGGLFIDIIRNAVDGFFGTVPETTNIATQKTAQNEAEKRTISAKATTQNSQDNFVPMDVENPIRDGPRVTFAFQQPQQTGNERCELGWTFVAPNQSQTNENAQTGQATAPNFVHHENPRIVEGLAQLHDMGFSNENGVLTRLLERFDGNVPQVVKAIVDAKI